ncbi:Chtf8 [Scenedesmus sp. PABB004]|nr:Chtf8 [Scenedesmus sp. PABB004]
MLVRVAGPDGAPPEWALVELQGKIEPQRPVEPGEALTVGALQLSAANPDVVTLQVGYHVLEGRRVALKKPLAILENQAGRQQQQEQQQQQQQEQQQEHGGGSQDGAAGSQGGAVTCKVIGVLRHKYLFKNRPKALISKPGRG